MRLLRRHARIAICGAISQYNLATSPAMENYLALLATRSSARGFVVFDFADRYDEGEEQLAAWVDAGKLTFRVDIVDGLTNSVKAIQRLFDGSNKGKLLVRI